MGLLAGLACKQSTRLSTSSQQPKPPQTTNTPNQHHKLSTNRPQTPKHTTFKQPSQATQAKAAPFAVVELFTSEGCSSCPPAEHFANQLAALANKTNKRIFPIVYHVDYWNHLGWQDRFGKRIFTDWQREYATHFGSRTVYTPQMIVNGQWQFVGSHRATGHRWIKHALRQTSPRALAVCIKTKKHSIQVRYRASHPTTTLRIRVSLVERGLASRVTRGENAGRILKGDNIVRSAAQQPLRRQTGNLTLALPRPFNRAKSALIAYLQHPGTMRIVAATHIDLADHNATCQ